MKTPLQLTYRGMKPSATIDTAVHEKAAKLEQFHPSLTSCRVTIGQPGRHKHQGKEFAVHIDITVPGAEIAVTREHDEDFLVATRDAFNAARRKLDSHARKQRGEVKQRAAPNRKT